MDKINFLDGGCYDTSTFHLFSCVLGHPTGGSAVYLHAMTNALSTLSTPCALTANRVHVIVHCEGLRVSIVNVSERCRCSTLLT